MEIILGTVLIGVAMGLASYASRDYYQRGLDYIEANFREKLRRLRVNTKNLRRFLKLWALIIVLTFLGVTFFANSIIFGTVAGGLVVGLPWYILARMAEQRKVKIEDQLADAMVSLSSAIKAGLALAQALEILAQQCPKPICQEFQQLIGEYQLGKPLETCLLETKQRLRSENFALFAASLEASRQSGGKLNETVERIAHSVRELQRLERKIQSETAQARKSALYMAMAPFAILAIYYFVVDQENTEKLFTTVLGQIMLSASLVLNLVAYFWARKILNPEI